MNTETKPKGMTLQQFRASGRDVPDLGVELPGMDLDGTAGRVYLHEGGAYIERWEDDRHGVAPPNGPTWLLTLGRDQYDGDLPRLEELLHEWCAAEGFFDSCNTGHTDTGRGVCADCGVGL